MSTPELEKIAADKCAVFGLHPKHDPLGDCHHVEVPFTEEDSATGDALAWFLGSLFSDINDAQSGYFYTTMTSVDEWSRVARALRVHGLKIVDL